MRSCARQQFRLLVLRHRCESLGEVYVIVQSSSGNPELFTVTIILAGSLLSMGPASRWKRDESNYGQVNEMFPINDPEEACAGPGCADYGRETEVLSGRD